MKNLTNDKIIHIKKDNIEYIQFKKLLEYKDIITHAYTLKKENQSFKTKNELETINAIENYKILCKDLNLNYVNIIKCNQTHTSNIKIVSEKINTLSPDINLEEYNDIDGLITDKKNLILSTVNADCILFILFDPVKKIIANIHSGWRGTLKEIVIKCAKIMHKNYGCEYKNIICCISPSIRVCHFEVDAPVEQLFYQKYKNLKNINKIIIPKENNKYNIDTVLLNITLLKKLGLKEENIIDSNICSVCNKENINSYRSDKPNYNLSTMIICLK